MTWKTHRFSQRHASAIGQIFLFLSSSLYLSKKFGFYRLPKILYLRLGFIMPSKMRFCDDHTYCSIQSSRAANLWLSPSLTSSSVWMQYTAVHVTLLTSNARSAKPPIRMNKQHSLRLQAGDWFILKVPLINMNLMRLRKINPPHIELLDLSQCPSIHLPLLLRNLWSFPREIMHWQMHECSTAGRQKSVIGKAAAGSGSLSAVSVVWGQRILNLEIHACAGTHEHTYAYTLSKNVRACGIEL
jgi:hypothetical protein